MIASPLDFVGINIYTPTWIRADDSPLGFTPVPNPGSYPHMASSWLTIGPEALYWGPRNVAKIWKAKEIYITENGCSSSDVPAADGIVYDTDRVMYLRNYLSQLQRATADGVPVKGYFLWSLMDNFEWADGYQPLRAALRGLYDAEADTEVERVVLSGGDCAECGGVTAMQGGGRRCGRRARPR